MQIEVIGGFDWSVVSPESKAVVDQQFDQIRALLRSQTYNAVEIGVRLGQIKEALPHGQFENWVRSEFPWGVQAARRFQEVARAFSDVVEIAQIERFDLSALYLLAPDSAKDAREKAIALAQSGQRISHARAKELKAGSDTTTITAGEVVTVADETSDLHGQEVTVRSTNLREGYVVVETAHAGLRPIPLAEILPPTEPKPPTQPKQPKIDANLIERINQVEADRVTLLERKLKEAIALLERHCLDKLEVVKWLDEARELL